MIVGYLGENEVPYCAECWSNLKAARRGPWRRLTTKIGDRRDTFRIIDDCHACHAQIDYEDIEDSRASCDLQDDTEI